mgnify:FL=1
MTEKERLEKLMEQEQISQTQFADKIGIQRSTLSHIMKGRNAPSLDVLQKTLKVFHMVNSDWLILGVGPMYRTNPISQQTLFDIKPEVVVENVVPTEKAEDVLPKETKKELVEPLQIQAKTITKIVVFYSDNTFEELLK